MLATQPASRALARSSTAQTSRINVPAASLAASRSSSRRLHEQQAIFGSRRRGRVVGGSVVVASSTSPSPEPRRPASDNLPPLRVVVTGGSKGIGRALVEGFLASGDDVAFCSRDASRVAEAERELKSKFSASSSSPKIFSAPCDVSKPGDARRFAAQATEALGGIDVWINNAGMSTWGSLADDDREPSSSSDSDSGASSSSSSSSTPSSSLSTCDEAEIAAVVATNVTGTILGTRAAILALSEQRGGGHIYNMDGAGSDGSPTPFFASYGCSKSALAQFHKSVKAELKQLKLSEKVAVHRISPGMVTTDLLMKGTGRPRARFFVNALAESPADSAGFLVPRIREIARRPPSSGPDAPSAAFLTPAKALGLLLARVTTGARKDRFLVEE